MNSSNFRRPSALLPLVMSLLALATLVVHLGTSGAAAAADEGTAAHIFQWLVGAQIPFVLYQAVRWTAVPRAQGVQILGLQLLALLAVCAPVRLLGL